MTRLIFYVTALAVPALIGGLILTILICAVT